MGSLLGLVRDIRFPTAAVLPKLLKSFQNADASVSLLEVQMQLLWSDRVIGICHSITHDSNVKAGNCQCKVKGPVFEVLIKDQIALVFSLRQHKIES